MNRFALVFLAVFLNLLAFASPANKSRLLNLLSMTDFYIASGNYEKAADFCNQALILFKQIGAENDNTTISNLHGISHAYAEKGMYRDAVKTETLLVEVFPLAMPDNVYDYALYLHDLSFYLMSDDCIELAAQKINEALSLIENKNDVNLSIIYMRAAEIYHKTNPPRIDLSIEYQKRVVSSYATSYGKASSTYLDELWYLANYYESAELYDDACNAYLEIMHTRANDEEEQNMPGFLPVLDKIIFCSHKINNNEREEQCKQIALSIKLQEQGFHEANYSFPEFPSLQDSLDYITISDNLESFRSKISQLETEGNEEERRLVQNDRDEYLEAIPPVYGKAYALSLETLRNSWLFRWEDTIKYGLNAIQVFDEIGIITDKYVIDLCCLADAYNELYNPAKAYDYILRAYELRDDYLSSDHIYFDGILSDLALYCSRLGNYRDAIRYGLIAVKSKEPYIYSDSPYTYFNSLNNLATYYGDSGNREAELEVLQYLFNRAEEIAPSVLEYPESPFLYNLASCYSASGNYAQAINTGLRVKEIREKWGGGTQIASIDLLLARTYRRDGQLYEALKYAVLASDLLNKIGGDDNLSLSHTYDLLAMIYKDLGKFAEAEKMERQAMNLTCNNIINNFADLSAEDRASYWSRFSNLFNVWYPNYFYRANIKDASELYNKSALFAKGILLNSETELSKLLIESGDVDALKKYHQLLNDRSQLSKIESGISDSIASDFSDSLKADAIRIERELIKECKAFGDYTANMRTTWRDVQAALHQDDAAIEFLAFPLIDKDDKILNNYLYAAIVLKKKETQPHFIALFSEEELNAIGNNDLYGKRLYKLVWGSLDKYLSDVKNIYFSPAGKLYNINIEVLPEIVSKNKNKNYYRVSSTRILAHSPRTVSGEDENTILYGGLKYDTSISQLVASSREHNVGNSSYSGDIENIDLRYGWGYLPETLTEVNSIESILKQSDIPTQVYTGVEGTEDSFKSYNGQSCKIIHLATHGFYYTASDSVSLRKAHLDYMSNGLERDNCSYVGDLSLTRSGLLMSGCDNILHGEQLPGGIEDGILFSKEIANMNMKRVELITLSACDSGLGDITGEGVFGLQRAFKKAGAQAILMSLWKVDDKATCLLMTRFYENLLLRRMTKIESLKDAQKFVRAYENGEYNDPKYWAAFILLDAF